MAGKLSLDGLRRIASRQRAKTRRPVDLSKTPRPANRDRIQWITLIAVSLPGLAALVALLFTWLQVKQNAKQLDISEQGQITSRLNAAVTNLGSPSIDVRIGGIYALDRLSEDSKRDEETIPIILSAYVRNHAHLSAENAKKTQSYQDDKPPPADIAAAADVLMSFPVLGDGAHDEDLSHTDLRGLDAGRGDTNFEATYFGGSNLSGAEFASADLKSAILDETNLHTADMNSATLNEASFEYADLTGVDFTYATAKRTDFNSANLTNAHFNDADLTNADFTGANLTNADFTGAIQKGMKLDGAKLDGAIGLSQSRR
ncbi:hypothetical protein C3489_07905 [Streptomyces sp. Ru71]|nr:hypothetical protein C3489_07905 [Streptomyces sp. Ru71]